MKKKVVLITGVAGFIGSHTAELFLKKGFIVKGIDNLSSGNEQNVKFLTKKKNFYFKKIDLLNLKKNNFYKDCKYIIHFAGLGDIVPSINFPKKYFENNFNGTLNLLNLFRNLKVKKFVFAASSSCYGIAKTPTNENAKIDPQYPYALSKYFAEQLCLHWGKVYKMPVNSIRIFNAYGTRSRTTGAYGAVMGVFMKQFISNKPFTVVGNGRQKRDFLYVSDVANAFYKAATTKLSYKVWNLGSSKPQNILKLCKLLDKKNKIINIPTRPGEPKVTYAKITRIKKDLKWKPIISLEKGIQIIKKNKNYWNMAPLWTKKSIQKATKNWFKYLKK